MKIRPSSAPRAFECPSSMLEAVAPINSLSDSSDLGTAAHEALAEHVRGGEIDLDALALDTGTDVDDLSTLVAFGKKAWAEAGRLFGRDVQTEVALESDITDGRTDLLRADDQAIVVGDWKSGRVRRSYRRQLQAYAYAARATFGMPSSGTITAVVVWLRFGEFEVMQFTDAQLDQFRVDFLALERQVGRQYAPGEHCTFCPRQFECEARTALLRSTTTALSVANEDALTPERMAELYPRVQALEKAIEAYKTALRLQLARGPMDAGDGRQLELVEARRAVIDARLAWPVLQSVGFSDDDLARCVTISKGEVEAVAGEKAPAREKGKRKAALVRALEEAGALHHTTFTKIQITKSAAESAEKTGE